ncbi:MAG TPA: dihydrofolate reductase family protein, partial [Thermoanaerobaculia bacterium]|nr:dihydrofolate reductase family protein [Thermoanaerobaculia bacterium]
YVLSNHDLPAPPPGISVERMSGEPGDIVARLTSRGIGHIYVDGGITIQRFLRAGLIQHLTVTHVPVLIGEGIALFGPIQSDIVLRLISSRQFPGGAVRSEYAIGT